jgi:hypothetical protein
MKNFFINKDRALAIVYLHMKDIEKKNGSWANKATMMEKRSMWALNQTPLRGLDGTM